MLTRSVQTIITYTGGICGTFILLIFPLILVIQARKRRTEDIFGKNFNRSPFKSKYFEILVGVYAIITLTCVITGLILGGSGE
jgi:amino acid permease